MPHSDALIVVSGVPRSGTSLAMQVLAAGGLRIHSDGRRRPDASNPRGYYEHETVKRLGSDLNADAWCAELGGGVLKVVHALVASLPPRPVGGYRVVWMTRSMAEVVASQDAMLARQGATPGALPPDRVAQLLESDGAAARTALEARTDCTVLGLDAGQLRSDPAESCARLAAFVGADLDTEAMEAAVVPGLLGRAGGYNSAMTVNARETAGSLQLETEHREPGPVGGPTLRVRDDQGREVLRFDAFARDGHWHAQPHGADQISAIPSDFDAIEWTLTELRRDAAGYLERGGVTGAADPAAFLAAVERLEPGFRNGPSDFDALEPKRLLQRTGEKWTQYPDDVLPLWVADMDFHVADPIQRRLQRALDLGDIGYPWHPQPTAIPGLFAERMKRLYDWELDPRRVELMTEVVQTMYVAAWQFTEPGDGIIVQRPIYPPFVATVEKLGRRLEDNALVSDDGTYGLDLDLLREQAKRSKMLLFCNPHNPTGRVLRRDELEAIGEVVVEHDLIVVSDEIHQDLVYPGAKHIPFASLSPEVEARTITVTSGSKAFNIAGLRCAVAVFGSAKLRARFLEFPRHIRGGLNSLGIMATEAAWAHGDPWLEDVRAYLLANRDFTAEFIRSEMPGVKHTPPEATYLAWLDCRALELPSSPGPFFLEHARVGLSDGPGYGPQGEGFVRINFATSRAILEDALGRMAKALRSR